MVTIVVSGLIALILDSVGFACQCADMAVGSAWRKAVLRCVFGHVATELNHRMHIFTRSAGSNAREAHIARREFTAYPPQTRFANAR